jgi:Fe-S-cluster-containing hydrogenase component 2
MSVIIDPRICDRCGDCVKACPEQAIALVDDRPWVLGMCTDCLDCVRACVIGAIMTRHDFDQARRERSRRYRARRAQ